METLALRLDADTTWARRAFWIIKPLCLLRLISVERAGRWVSKLVRVRAVKHTAA